MDLPAPRHHALGPSGGIRMKKISTSIGRRGLDLLKIAGAGMRLRRGDSEKVAHNAQRFLTEAMGRMKGLPQKLGQILSMSESELADGFEELTGNAQALEFSVVEQVLAQEWQRPWRQVLGSLEPEALAASLGQVHRGTLPDGRPVAVKVQYPGIGRAVVADLKMLGWLSAPLGGFRRAFNLQGYREELARDFEEELDYQTEAENQHQYHFLSQYQPNLAVPAIHGGLCTRHVLVGDWEEGETLVHVAEHWSPEERAMAARAFLEHALGFFRHGFVHADLHPGNYRFRRHNGAVQLLLYDFGCIFRAPLELRLAFLRLIQITEAGSAEDPYPLFVEMGFNPEYLEPMADKLPALCRVLLEPFIIPAPYDITRWHLGERVADVLGDDRWNFRVAGPPEIIFMMRMFHGLLHALRTLGGPQNWHHLMAPIRTHFAAETAALQVSTPPRQDGGFGQLARHLKIKVVRDGETRVQLTSPWRMIDNLDELMDEELRAQIVGQGTDIEAIVHRVRASGYRPQELFRLRDEHRDITIWLE